MTKKHQKGFTLVELLVVIAIIGLLSTIAVVALGSVRQKSRDTTRVSDIKQVQTALELYFDEQDTYPAGAGTVLGGAASDCLDSAGFVAQAACGASPYMGIVPANPTPGGAAFTYTQTGGGTGYTITFTLEGQTGGLGAGAHTASEDGIQ